MRQIHLPLILIVIFSLLISGCNMPFGTTSTVLDQSVVDTAVAQTVQAAGGVTSETITPEGAVPATNTPKPDVPEATSTETLTPTITITPTSSIPMIHSTMDTNCRYGPGIVYGAVGFLLTTDAPVEVRGRLESGGWWYIQNPRYPDQSCWVWDDTTVVEGNTNYLPFITPPPTPTMTPTPRPTIAAWADPANYTGACPVTVTFYATITVAGPVNITYQWESSAGGTDGPHTIAFAAAGAQTVSIPVSIGVDRTGWVLLHITSPINVSSNQAAFAVNCP